MLGMSADPLEILPEPDLPGTLKGQVVSEAFEDACHL
jgi:hypothetical protein